MFSLRGSVYTFNRSCNRVLRISGSGTWEATAAVVPLRLINTERRSCIFTWTERTPGLNPDSPDVEGTAYLYHLTQGCLFSINHDLTFTTLGTGPTGMQGVIAASSNHIYIILIENSPKSITGHAKVYLFDLEARAFLSTNIDLRGMPVFAHAFNETVVLLVLRQQGTRSELGILKLFKTGGKITINELIIEDSTCEAYHMTVIFQNRYLLTFFQHTGRECVRIYDSVSEIFTVTYTSLRPVLFTDVVGVVHKKLCRILMRTGSFDLPEELIDILYRISSHGDADSDSLPLPRAEFYSDGTQPTTPRALFTKNPLSMLNGSVSVSNVPLVDGIITRIPSRRASSAHRASTPTMKYTLTSYSPQHSSKVRSQPRVGSVPSSAVQKNIALSERQNRMDATLKLNVPGTTLSALENELLLLKGRNTQLEQELRDTRADVFYLKTQVLFLSDTIEELKTIVRENISGAQKASHN